jgi:hypothetical protein
MDVTDPAVLAPSFQYRDSNIAGGTAVGTIVLPPNPRRVSIVVSGSSGNFAMRPDALNGSVQGMVMGGTSGFFQVIKFSDIGGLVTHQWVCTLSPTGTVQFAEIIYYPLG